VIALTRIGGIDRKQKGRIDEVMDAAIEAIEASVGYVDSTFFTEERMRVQRHSMQ
jgi:hypothetical protein